MSRGAGRGGFTLVELLVVIAIIAVLGGLGFGAFGVARRKANQSADVAAARRLMQAYLAKTADDAGVLPRGRYPEDAIPEVVLEDGTRLSTIAQKVVLQRYPWHLAQYLGWKVEGTFVTWANRAEYTKALEFFKRSPALGRSQYYYLISVNPAFGHNVYGIGGWDGSPTSDAVTRLAQVQEPSRLIVFASSKGNSAQGYSYIEPPTSVQDTHRFDGSVEAVSMSWGGGEYEPERASEHGYLALSHERRAVVAFLDGHVALMGLNELRDSRLWSARAQAADDADYRLKR